LFVKLVANKSYKYL